MLDKDSLKILMQAVERLDKGYAALPAFEPKPAEAQKIAEVLGATADRLHDNYPYFHPLYAGQMLKPPHPIARAARSRDSVRRPRDLPPFRAVQ